MKNINHKDSFFLSRKAPTFASGNGNKDYFFQLGIAVTDR